MNALGTVDPLSCPARSACRDTGSGKGWPTATSALSTCLRVVSPWPAQGASRVTTRRSTALGEGGVDHVGFDCLDIRVADEGEVGLADALASLRVEGIHRGAKTHAERDCPPVLRRAEGLGAGLRDHAGGRQTGVGEKGAQRLRLGNAVPRVEATVEVGLLFADGIPEGGAHGFDEARAPRGDGEGAAGGDEAPELADGGWDSGTKKMPKTQTTASKPASGRPRSSMSPVRNSMLVRPRCWAFARARASSFSARSTPRTWPSGATASAAGRADAPDPQQASSTRIPGRRTRRSTVRRP